MKPSPLIDCQNISVHAGRVALIEKVSLRIRPGERVAIVGPSGAGKSTLLRAIAGLQSLSSGEILLNGIPASTADRTLIPPHQRGIGLLLQDLGLWPGLSVLDHLLLAARPPGRSRREQLAAARSLLDQLGLSSHARRRPGGLSGGEQQRLALGTVLMGEPRALLLDEPFQALDLVLKEALIEMVDEWVTARRCAVICVTHDPGEALQFRARRLMVFESAGVGADVAWPEEETQLLFESPTLSAWRRWLRDRPALPACPQPSSGNIESPEPRNSLDIIS